MDQVVKIRVILDVEEDIFRDIEIELDAPLMHLHLSTLDAFNWDNANEMASFYQSNEAWDKGSEYPLMAMGPEFPSMENATVRDILPTPTARGLYVYDYLRMWCFYLEPLAMGAAEDGVGYPRLMMEFGTTPDPMSREPEGLDDARLLDDVFSDDAKAGDPEIDAYLDEDDDETPGMENIDDHVDLF